MTPAELLCAREYLGLPKMWLADHVSVDLKTWWRYETGRSPVPDSVAQKVRRLLEHSGRVVSELTTKAAGVEGVSSLLTWPDDAVLEWFPPSWHRMVVSRVAERTGQQILWGSTQLLSEEGDDGGPADIGEVVSSEIGEQVSSL